MQYKSKYEIKCGLDVDFVVFPGLNNFDNKLLNELSNLTDEYHCGFMIEDKVKIYKILSDIYHDVPIISIHYEEDNYEFNEKLFDLCKRYCKFSGWLLNECCYGGVYIK